MLLFHALRTAGSPALSVTFGSTSQTSTAATSHTLTVMAIGTASLTRRVVVVVSLVASSGTDTVSSVTIAGISATKDAETTGQIATAIFSAIVPTGTTATVVIGLTTSRNLAASTFYVTGASNVLHDFGSGLTDEATLSLNLSSIKVGNVVVYGASQQSGTAIGTATLSVGGTPTESVDTTFTASSIRRFSRGRSTITSNHGSSVISITGDAATTKKLVYSVYKSS